MAEIGRQLLERAWIHVREQGELLGNLLSLEPELCSALHRPLLDLRQLDLQSLIARRLDRSMPPSDQCIHAGEAERIERDGQQGAGKMQKKAALCPVWVDRVMPETERTCNDKARSGGGLRRSQ